MPSIPTSPTNPDYSICKWIQVRILYETESRFGQIEYGLGMTFTLSRLSFKVKVIGQSQSLRSQKEMLHFQLWIQVVRWCMHSESLEVTTAAEVISATSNEDFHSEDFPSAI